VTVASYSLPTFRADRLADAFQNVLALAATSLTIESPDGTLQPGDRTINDKAKNRDRKEPAGDCDEGVEGGIIRFVMRAGEQPTTDTRNQNRNRRSPEPVHGSILTALENCAYPCYP
jgi:hypothetical protein